MFPMTRRPFLKSIAASACLALHGHQAIAQSYPTRPIKLVVNFPPGGPLDILARLLSSRLTATLRQPVVVENVAGAGGAIGAGNVSRSSPDGHTLLLSIDSPFTSGVAWNPKTATSLEDFSPVITLGQTSLALAVHPSTGVKSIADLVELGRKAPVTFSTAGLGSPGHFAAMMLSDATRLRINPIAYRGNQPAITALLSGEVQAGFLAIPGLLPHLNAGKLNGLVVAGAPSALLPELRTMGQAGYANVELTTYFVLMAPAKTAVPVLTRLYQAVEEIMLSTEVRQQLRSMDITIQPMDGQRTSANLTELRSRFQRIVKTTGMKPD